MARNPLNADVKFLRSPGLPGVEVRYSSYALECFRAHSHPTYSVGLVESGSSAFVLEGGGHPIRSGEIALINPGEVHACNPLEGLIVYRMFYLDAGLLAEAGAEIYGPERGPFRFLRPVVDDPELFAAFLDLYRLMEDQAGALALQDTLFTGLALLLERHVTPDGPRLPDAGECAAWIARDLLTSDVTRNISLDELAQAADLSRYHLLRVFRRTFGMPPHAYQNQLRVEMAKTLLRANNSIAQTAHEAGFTDQSHFTRVFREYTGATPNQFLG